ncbi:MULTISPECIES: RNA polymerase sigma factor [Paenibacillus]|uniref:RNA polymerase sigma factor n=1 Tax=Paenibacillus TaxID=44249 RepID=UPI0021B4188E|nr:RNA polymerase sigma factor [Paenibacillus sp. IHBB 10380]
MSKYALDVPALQAKLHQYCLHVTGERWEAEDLLQETMIKVMRAVEIKPDRPITNAYLYRIASNAWKDRLRKEKSVKSVTDEELKDKTRRGWRIINEGASGDISRPVISTRDGHFAADGRAGFHSRGNG